MSKAVAEHIKVLACPSSALHDRRQQAEIGLIQNLKNGPGLPCFREHGVTRNGRRFLAYQRVSGDTLESQLNQQCLFEKHKVADRQMPTNWVTFTIRLLRCVKLLHDQRPPIFHGDISARNVLIDNRGMVGLIDFGVARSRCLPYSLRFPSRQSTAAPRFLSPEQAQGRFWGSASDVYQVGLVAMTFIRGTPLNPESSVEDILYRLRNCPGHAQQLAAQQPDLAGSILPLLLDPAPHRRPSAGEALQLLCNV